MCPEGNAWSNERKAVCLIETENGSRGSGALVMNTCGVNKPYLLTAWHIVNGLNPNNWTFIFGWWSSTCTPNTNNQQALLFNGASLRATYQQTDCSLLELFQTPPSTSDITYLGWSRSSSIPSTSVGIHHPMGDQMKISFANSPATIGTIYTYPNTAWRVLWNLGTIENGSSGSPLFDPNHRVIGQLYSGTQPVGPPCNQLSGGTNYGRFDLSWTGGGTNATRLSNWLDPTATGAMTTNTTNISTLIPTSFSISGDASFCTTSNLYTIPGLPTGATVTWSWFASPYGSVQINSPNADSTTLTKLMDGTITLTATINNVCGTNQIVITKQITVGNPLNGTINQGGVLTSMNTVNFVSAGPTLVNFQWPNVTGISLSSNPPASQTGFIYYPSTHQFWFTLSSGQSITVSFSGTGCSGSTIATRSFNVGGHYYVISPNPASGTVTISPNPNSSISKVAIGNTGIIQVAVTDVNGILKKQQQFSANTANMQLNVAGLIPGTYFVQIINGDIHDTQQLIINR